MDGLLRVTIFILLIMLGIGSGHADELDEQLQAIQTKLDGLGNGEETPQKKRLREIFNDHRQVLLDHQEYLKKTANYSQQLEKYPQQLEKLKKSEALSDADTVSPDELAKLSLSELERRHVATQANLSELQNQQQKLAAEITKLRQRAATIREEQASINTSRAMLADDSEIKKTSDKKVFDALERYRDAQLQALTDKTRMLELETLVLPNAIEVASLQEKLSLTPKIRMLEQEVDLLAEEINRKRRAETEEVVEKSQQLLGEKE